MVSSNFVEASVEGFQLGMLPKQSILVFGTTNTTKSKREELRC